MYLQFLRYLLYNEPLWHSIQGDEEGGVHLNLLSKEPQSTQLSPSAVREVGRIPVSTVVGGGRVRTGPSAVIAGSSTVVAEVSSIVGGVM